LRGIGGGCDEEAVRVVKLMPKWKPGRQKGKAVSVRYNMPIQFGLGGLPENQPDKYMNQALKSMKNGDTCKSCAELYEARLYGNSYAAKLYEQICFRHDTIREINDSLRKEIPGLNYIVAGYAKCKADTSYAYFNANMERITAIVETAPEFPGGDHGRMVYLQNTMKYPQEAREQGIQGTVYVTFTIDTDGSITDIAVLKSPHILLSEEAVRVVKLMPKWKPGTQRGKPVKVQINMPLAFTLSH